MTTLFRAVALLSIGSFLTAGAGARVALAAVVEKPKHYVCDPCGMPCDKTVYDAPGTCPVCGARLVTQKAAEAAMEHPRASKKVGIVIFNGVEIIDYTGPWEVFGTADYEVYTVAGTKEPVTTAMGMTVVPKYTFADAPQPDVLLVPGGDVAGPRASAATLKWIKDTSARAQHTMSVCNGAFILASAGLLDGLGATTTYHLLDKLTAEFPRTRVVRDQRFVDNGRIITAGGLSSGIDGALHVVSRMLGNGIAQEVALGMEYDWRPGAGFARGALADRLIPELDLDDLGTWSMVSTEGGTDRWEIVFRATSDLSAPALVDRLGRSLAARGKWISVKGASASSSSLTSAWTFSDPGGKTWTGTLTVQAIPGENGQYTAKLRIAQGGSDRERSAGGSLLANSPRRSCHSVFRNVMSAFLSVALRFR